MFTTEDYLYGWLLYIVAGLVFMACWWWLTAKLRVATVRHALRLIAGVTIFFPWPAGSDTGHLAPAVVMAGVEGIFDGGEAFWRAGGPLLTALAVALVSGVILAVVRGLSRSGTAAAKARP